MNERPVGVPARSSGKNSWVNIVLGIWVIISPFVLGIHSAKGVWNNIVTVLWWAFLPSLAGACIGQDGVG